MSSQMIAIAALLVSGVKGSQGPVDLARTDSDDMLGSSVSEVYTRPLDSTGFINGLGQRSQI